MNIKQKIARGILKCFALVMVLLLLSLLYMIDGWRGIGIILAIFIVQAVVIWASFNYD